MELVVDAYSSVPTQDQLSEQIRRAYLAGDLKPGVPLPSSRQLANDHEISHESVLKTYEALKAGDWIDKGLTGRPRIHPDAGRQAERAFIGQLEGELKDASQMQSDLLPDAEPLFEGVDVSGICVPANQVGGDYYAYLTHWEDRLAVVLADVSGHGMKSATVAIRFSEMLRYEARDSNDVEAILSRLSESLRSTTPEEMMVTCGIGLVDRQSKVFRFTSAGHPRIFRRSGEDRTIEQVFTPGIPLGIGYEHLVETAYGSIEFPLDPGSVFVLASDGVEETRNPAGEFYGEDRLAAVVGRFDGSTARVLRDSILADLRAFRDGEPPADDLTIVVLSVE